MHGSWESSCATASALRCRRRGVHPSGVAFTRRCTPGTVQRAPRNQSPAVEPAASAGSRDPASPHGFSHTQPQRAGGSGAGEALPASKHATPRRAAKDLARIHHSSSLRRECKRPRRAAVTARRTTRAASKTTDTHSRGRRRRRRRAAASRRQVLRRRISQCL